jgi:HlyD family secretion protein
MNSFGVFKRASVAAVLLLAASGWCCGSAGSESASANTATSLSATVTVRRGSFTRTVRVAGITEAVRNAAAVAPRLAGQNNQTLTITKLVASGARVKAGEVLVEFDPQDQNRAAFDRRTEFQDLEQQIRRVEAEQATAYAADETAMKQAENDVSRAELDTRKNRVLPPIEADKNNLALEEATARLTEVRQARALRRRTAAADMKILEIRRARMEQTLKHAEENAAYMVIRAPFDGLSVVQPVFKGSAMTEVQEGDDVRPGMPIVSVVDPTSMQVRARVSQVDRSLVAVGQPARVTLDAYPGVSFDGKVAQLAPLAITSSVTAAVRGFVAIVSIAGSDAVLMPDLSAAVDVTVQQRENVLVIPRESVAIDKTGAWVMVKQGGSFVRRAVTLGEVGDVQVVVASGVAEGAVLARRAAGGE